MNEEQARAASASIFGELGISLRQSAEKIRADDAAERRAMEDRVTSRLTLIDRRLEEIAVRIPADSSRTVTRRAGLFVGPISSATVVVAVVLLLLVGSIGGKVLADRAFASGRATGYAQAAVFEREHPSQWRAYQRTSVSLLRR